MCLTNNEGLLKQKQSQYNMGMGMANLGNIGIFGKNQIKMPNQMNNMGMAGILSGIGLRNNPKQTVKAQVVDKSQPARPATPVPKMGTGEAAQPAPAQAPSAVPSEAAQPPVEQAVGSPIADAMAQAAQAFYFNPRRGNAQRVVA